MNEAHSRVGAPSSNFDFLQEIGPKIGGGDTLSQDYSNSKQALTSIAPHLQVELQFSILLLSVIRCSVYP